MSTFYAAMISKISFSDDNSDARGVTDRALVTFCWLPASRIWRIVKFVISFSLSHFAHFITNTRARPPHPLPTSWSTTRFTSISRCDLSSILSSLFFRSNFSHIRVFQWVILRVLISLASTLPANLILTLQNDCYLLRNQ